jgi:hypothetical protein
VQLTHAIAPVPQAVSWLPAAQMLPTQHPAAQFAALQPAAGVHTPLVHVSFIAQPLQTSPPFPHAAGVVATTQLLPTQQPGQFAALQVTGVWHVRSFGCPCGTHVFPVAAQFEQASPCLPQATESVPATHVAPLQHPPQF